MYEKISQYIEKQFPAFYRDEGPRFIAFLKAYYEWLEKPENVTYKTRHLLTWSDVDTTIDDFILYFKEEYLKNIQFNTASNKQLLIKNSTDLYRSKGTERSIDLFFRLVYGVDAEVQYPAEKVFRLSDGVWEVPYYLEITYNRQNINYIGKQIVGSQSGATAFVERYIRRRAGYGTVNLIYISGLVGQFTRGETIGIMTNGSPVYTENSARLVGSVTSVIIQDNGIEFSVGDIVTFEDSERGRGGTARVTAIGEETGVVDFILHDGGWGYSLNAESIVSEKVLLANNVYGNNFALMETISQPLVEISFSNAAQLSVGDTIRSYNGSNNIANGVIIELNQNTGSANGTATISFRSGPFTTGTYYINSNTSTLNAYAVADATIRGSLMNYPRKYDLTVADSSEFILDQTVYSNSGAIGIVTNINGDVITVESQNGQFANGDGIGNTVVMNVGTRLGVYGIAKRLKTLTISNANTPSEFLTSPFIYQYGTVANSISSAVSIVSSVSGNSAVVSVLQMKGIWNQNYPLETVNSTSNGSFTYSETATGGDYVMPDDPNDAYWIATSSNTAFTVERISDGSGASFNVGSLGDQEQILINTDFLNANAEYRFKTSNYGRSMVFAVNASTLGVKTGDIMQQKRGWQPGINVLANFDPTTGIWLCNTGTSPGYVNGAYVTYEVSAGNTVLQGMQNGVIYACNVINTTAMTLYLPENGMTINSTNIPDLGSGRVSESGHGLILNIYGTIESISGNTVILSSLWPVATSSAGGSRPFTASAAGITSNVFLVANTAKNTSVSTTTNYTDIGEIDYPMPYKNMLLRTPLLGLPGLTTASPAASIAAQLSYSLTNVGSVASISAADPGSDYDIDPEVLIMERGIQALGYYNYLFEITNASSTFVVGEKINQTLPNTDVITLQVNWGVFEDPPTSPVKFFIDGNMDVSNTDDFILTAIERQRFNASYNLRPNAGFVAISSNASVGDLVRYFTEGSNTAVLSNNSFWRVQSVNSTGVVLANTTTNAVAIMTEPNTATFNPNTISNNYISIASNPFANDVIVRYVADTANTPVLGLSNNTNYYVVSSNSTVLRLSNTSGGNAIELTAGATETGHALVLYNTAANGHNLYVYHNEIPDGYRITYQGATGNGAITGLTNGTTYYVYGSNSSGVKLTSSWDGTAINITSLTGNTTAASGHFLTASPLQGYYLNRRIVSNTGAIGYVIDTYIQSANQYVVINNVSGTFNIGDSVNGVAPSSNAFILDVDTESVIVTAKGIVKEANNTHLLIKRIQLNDLWSNTLPINGEISGATANITNISAVTNEYQIGLNANVEANVITAEGQVTAFDIVDSGYGYTNNEVVQFVSADGSRAGTVKLIIGGTGRGRGYYRSSKGFLSNDIKLHDGDYYQEYSYEVFTKLSVDRYADMFKKVMHTAGTRFFGSVSLSEEGNVTVSVAESTITQE